MLLHCNSRAEYSRSPNNIISFHCLCGVGMSRSMSTWVFLLVFQFPPTSQGVHIGLLGISTLSRLSVGVAVSSDERASYPQWVPAWCLSCCEILQPPWTLNWNKQTGKSLSDLLSFFLNVYIAHIDFNVSYYNCFGSLFRILVFLWLEICCRNILYQLAFGQISFIRHHFI